MSGDESIFHWGGLYERGPDKDGFKWTGNKGLTKRELFAAMAMQGLLAGVYSDKVMLNEFTLDEEKFRRHLSGCDAITRCAFNYADALLAELDKGRSK